MVTLNRQARKLTKRIKIEQSKFKKGTNKTGKPSESHSPNTTRTKNTGIFNKEGKMVFSKFDFKETVKERPKKRGNRNVEKVLKQIEKDKEKMAEMKEKDPEKAKDIEEKKIWKTAVDRAEGIKVRLFSISHCRLCFIIHPCDPTVVICYLIRPCDIDVRITYLISHSSS